MVNKFSIGVLTEILVRSIITTSKSFVSVIFQFVRRERNSIANSLARTTSTAEGSLRIIDVQNFHIRKLSSRDKFDEPFIRLS